MGYTTKFDGTITTNPKMDWTMRAAVREYCANADIGKVRKNSDLDGTCDWKASDDFTGLVHNGMEKSYDQDQWLQALINDLLAPAGFICNGIVDAQGEDVSDRWRIIVRDNVVERDDFTGVSYAEKVNAPLSEETVEALNEELASGNAAKFHPQEELPPFDIGAALTDLGNAITFKSGQGLQAIADFASEVEQALELVDNEGDMGPLNAVFERIKNEHAAEIQRAETAAAVDNDIPDDFPGEYYGNGVIETGDDYEPNERVRQAARRLKDIGIDVTDNDQMAAHKAAWQKIHDDQAAEERVRERLQATADIFLDDDNLETWEPRPVPIPEPGPTDYLAADPRWMIWSNKHQAWWAPNRIDYTTSFVRAGRYSLEDATSIVKRSCRGWDPQQTSLPPTTMVPDPNSD